MPESPVAAFPFVALLPRCLGACSSLCIKPKRLVIIPGAIVIDEQLFPGFDKTHRLDRDNIVRIIHLVFAVGTIGVIVNGHIPQGHTAFQAVIAPLENIVMQQGLVKQLPVIVTHYDDGRYLHNTVSLQAL